jgi:hypothetical protein
MKKSTVNSTTREMKSVRKNLVVKKSRNTESSRSYTSLKILKKSVKKCSTLRKRAV